MDIPFFPNTGDGTHCFQAAMKMALAVMWPERDFSYEELDRISMKLPGKWTWPTAAMLWMIEQGLALSLIEDFDYRAFAERGGAYLVERYGKEVGEAQMAHSDVEVERDVSRRFADVAPIERRSPTIEDLVSEMQRGAVVIVNINAAPLYDLEGYSGHFVVLCEIADDAVVLHDPGLPPNPGVRVPLDRFLAAWAYPTDRDRNLLSIRKTSDSPGT
jgi:hypothetical protein